MNLYKCTRCGDMFQIEHEVDEESAVCDPCFKVIISSKTYDEYIENVNSLEGMRHTIDLSKEDKNG